MVVFQLLDEFGFRNADTADKSDNTASSTCSGWTKKHLVEFCAKNPVSALIFLSSFSVPKQANICNFYEGFNIEK